MPMTSVPKEALVEVAAEEAVAEVEALEVAVVAVALMVAEEAAAVVAEVAVMEAEEVAVAAVVVPLTPKSREVLPPLRERRLLSIKKRSMIASFLIISTWLYIYMNDDSV
jgi:hypothetical protein